MVTPHKQMKRTDYFELLAQLFEFKTVTDELGNEFVLFRSSPLETVGKIDDKTQFEAVENHIHLLEHIKAFEFEKLCSVSSRLGQALLWSLNANYPDKHFVVFVSLQLHDSMIIRFHQKWEGEEAYYDVSDFRSPTEKVLMFES